MQAVSTSLPEDVSPRLSWARELSRTAVIAIAGLALLLVLMVVHVQQGAADLDAATIASAIVAPDGSPRHAVVLHARLPRAAAGVVAGAALGIAGVLLQAATRNPLADASTVGVNAGAYLAVVATTIYAPALTGRSSPLVAFAGGLLAAGVVYLLGSGSDAAPTRLALAGMATTIALGSVTTTLILFHEYTVSGLFFWGAGSLIQRNWDAVADTWFWVALLGLAAATVQARGLDVLGLGDDAAASLGQNVPRARLLATLAGVLLAAFAIVVAGAIAFVGLVAPHLVRLAGVRGHARLIPLAALWGAVILVAADVAGRLVAGPMSELPAGVFTAAVGAPFLIWLARRVGQGGGRATTPAPIRSAVAVRPALLWAASILALLTALVAGLAFGDQVRGLPELYAALTGASDAMARDFVLNLRLPRLLTAALVGAALAVSGLILQGVVRNPLAAPDLVGVVPGAGVGAVALLIAIPNAPVELLPVAAFVGGVIAFALVYAVSWRGGVAPTRLALVGVGVSAAAASLTTMMVVQAELSMTVALAWLSGSTYAKEWGDLFRLLPWVVLLPLAWLLARWLDVMALGEDLPRALGVPLERARLALLGVAVGLAAVAVATVGALGFVGLIAPHAARLLLPGRHRLLLPYTALLGAILVVAADTVGRSVAPPSEIPSGLITAMIGAPYFLWLLARTRSAR